MNNPCATGSPEHPALAQHRLRFLKRSWMVTLATSTTILLSACSATHEYVRMPTPAADYRSQTEVPSWSPGPDWTLTWNDNFEDGAPLSDWGPSTGGTGWGQQQLQYYSPANISLDRGDGLVMTALKDAAGDQCWYGTCDYSSAQLDTKGHFEQQYGLFAADIRLPTGRGLWPAFWMVGADTGKAPYPFGGGEIDVIEINNHLPDDTVTAFVHSDAIYYRTHSRLPVPLSAGFHVYEAEWTPTRITFLVDGQEYGSVATSPGAEPFNQPFYLILSLAVGGNWPGPPDASTVFPAHMDVAWVRAYKQK